MQDLTSSWLLGYEVWNRLHAHAAPEAVKDTARIILRSVFLIDLAHAALGRALDPFPVAVKTLDGLHLASMDFTRNTGRDVRVATYDRRLAQAAEAMGFALWQWNES